MDECPDVAVTVTVEVMFCDPAPEALMERHARNCAQRLEISLLADRLSRIELSAHRRSEISDALNIVIRVEEALD